MTRSSENRTHQPTRQIILRIRYEPQGDERPPEVLFAPLEALREEEGGGYGGFERWKRDAYLPIELDRLLEVQRDLRLCLCWPDEAISFVDLLSEAELSTPPSMPGEPGAPADPFSVFAQAAREPLELWEYVPYTQELHRRFPLDDITRQWSATWEASLFDQG